MEEVYSYKYGRCFTLTSAQYFESSKETIDLNFRPDGPGMLAFFHEPGAELWMSADNWPNSIHEVEPEEIGEEAASCVVDTEACPETERDEDALGAGC